MAWIESHQTLKEHHKTKALKRALKIKTPQAIGHLHMLWWWCLDNAPDGDLSGIPDEDLAEAVEWTGDPKKFVDSLVTSGFIDGENRQLHDWYEYAGKLVDRRISNRERQTEFRNRHRNGNITVTSQLRNTPPVTARNGATVPNSTVPNSITNVIHTPTPLPAWLNVELWNDFLEMRKKKRAVPTEKAKELLILELDKLQQAGNNPDDVLKQSIARNYTGVFTLKKDDNLYVTKKDGGNNAANRGNHRQLPTRYTTPEELEQQERGNV